MNIKRLLGICLLLSPSIAYASPLVAVSALHWLVILASSIIAIISLVFKKHKLLLIGLISLIGACGYYFATTPPASLFIFR